MSMPREHDLLCPGAVMCCVALLAALSVSIEAEQKYAAQPLARNDGTPSHSYSCHDLHRRRREDLQFA